MKMLIVSATNFETFGLSEWLKHYGQLENRDHLHVFQQYQIGSLCLDTLVAGVGIHATTYSLVKHLQHHNYDFVLQAGVGGCFDTAIPLTGLVFIVSDEFADLGAEDKDTYLDIFDMGLLDKNTFPFVEGRLITPVSSVHDKILLPNVKGLTVNTTSGQERTIKIRDEKYNCSIESMEGAAFHYVCLLENVPFAQVRAISNYVTVRNKGSWKMKEAIINLNNWLIDFVENNR